MMRVFASILANKLHLPKLNEKLQNISKYQSVLPNGLES